MYDAGSNATLMPVEANLPTTSPSASTSASAQTGAPAGSYDSSLSPQSLDLLGADGPDEPREDVDRRDRALLDLVVVEDRRRRGPHRRVRERRGHSSLNHSQRVAESFAGFHLIRGRPSLELDELH